MSWIKRIINKNTILSNKKIDIPSGIWTKCDHCAQLLYTKELKHNLEVCPKCDYHMQISARTRLLSFLDPGSTFELGTDLLPKDILKFKDLKKYKDRLSVAQKTTKETEALIVMQGTLYNMVVVAAAFEFNFIGGSMSAAVGSRFVQAVNRSLQVKCPFICFSASGGARMQEAFISLMQMAKTSAVLSVMGKTCLPYISVLTNPTMGGVSASLGMLGDLNIAEPHALIGFAGPRVIEQTVREKLPLGFQRSEFLLEKGLIDLIIRRPDMRLKLAHLLAKLTRQSIPIA